MITETNNHQPLETTINATILIKTWRILIEYFYWKREASQVILRRVTNEDITNSKEKDGLYIFDGIPNDVFNLKSGTNVGDLVDFHSSAPEPELIKTNQYQMLIDGSNSLTRYSNKLIIKGYNPAYIGKLILHIQKKVATKDEIIIAEIFNTFS